MKKRDKKWGYVCLFVWCGANKYMYFVPFANGRAPPVLDKEAMIIMLNAACDTTKSLISFLFIHLQARQTPLNTLLIIFLSKIRYSCRGDGWVKSWFLKWNEFFWASTAFGDWCGVNPQQSLCITRSRDPVSHKKLFGYKIVTRNEELDGINKTANFEACLKWANRMIFTISCMSCL